MIDFTARHIIEALRSGISSREVGNCFSSARPKIMAEINKSLDSVSLDGQSGGTVLSGKYGEGKTHLLNTIFNAAHNRNMVVSLISISKETPFDKLHLVYPKVVQNTYLPKRMQPGFGQVFENMTQNNPIVSEMLQFALKDLEINKLYYLLKCYLGTEDFEEKFMLLADLEGDFIPNSTLKQIYKRIYAERIDSNANFIKTKHANDYFAFLSQLFLKLGYNGWVILIDEAELMGRLGKKARLNAYSNMAKFLFADKISRLKATYSIFAFNASFVSDVIEGKHEYENLELSLKPPESQKEIKAVLNAISQAPQLVPLNMDEIMDILRKIQIFHGKAYDWHPDLDLQNIFKITEKSGHLLRTRIRAAVELLDQLYQYGEAGNIRINELGISEFNEEMPSLSELLDGMD